MRKFGAIVGERRRGGLQLRAATRTLLGRRAVIFPLTPFRGTLPAGATARTAREPALEITSRQD